jgi:hypothetical protein
MAKHKTQQHDGAEVGQNEEPDASGHQASASDSQDNDDSATAFAAFATHAIAQGIENLHLDPQFLAWGQQAAQGAVGLVKPVRRALKAQPVLVGIGIGALAAGFALIGFALMREGNPLPRLAKSKHVN